MVKRQSPQVLAKQMYHLKTQRQKKIIKPPFNCPICFGIKTVTLIKKENFNLTFACGNGCFKETVKCKSSNFEPVDGYNIVMDRLRKDRR